MTAHLKNEFTEDEKYHNLMSWLIYIENVMRNPRSATNKTHSIRERVDINLYKVSIIGYNKLQSEISSENEGV